jgi:hypothetical protein
MGKHQRMLPKPGEDWLSVIISLLVILLVTLGGLAKVPWPLVGWFK